MAYHLCAQGDSLFREILKNTHTDKTMRKETYLLLGSYRRLTRDPSSRESSENARLLLTAIAPGFTCLPSTAKTPDRTHETTASEDGQWAAQICTPWEKGNKGESHDCPTYCLEATSTQQHSRKNPNGPSKLRKQKFKFTGHNTGEEETAQGERSGELQKSPLDALADLHMCGVKLHNSEKRTNGKQQAKQFVELIKSQKEFTVPPARVAGPHNT